MYYMKKHFRCRKEKTAFSVEALPGQFDQRADSAEQCVKLLNENEATGDPFRNNLCD